MPRMPRTTSPDRAVEQAARDRLHVVARTGPEGAAPVPGRARVPVRRPGAVPLVVPAPAAAASPGPSRRSRRGTEARGTERDGDRRDRPGGVAVPWLPARPDAASTDEVGPRPDVPPEEGDRVDGEVDAGAGGAGVAAVDAGVGDRVDARPDVRVEEEPRAPDVLDVQLRSRAEALAAAAAGYAQSYGHPLEHTVEDRPASGRRWWLSTRHAVVAGIAVVVLAVGIVVRASTELPGPAVPIGSSQEESQDESRGGSPHESPGGASPGGAVADGAVADGAVADGAASGTVAGGAVAGAGIGPVGAGTGGPAGGPGAASEAPDVVVHVVGQVTVPGVLTLPAGSRVSDAVAAAGGATAAADLTAVNLARTVVDGEQIHVPAHGEPPRAAPPGGPTSPTGGSSGASASSVPGVPVALNSADLSALDALPGIGPVLAQRILDWRTANGPFRSVEELGEVSGIGDALLTRLRPLVQV